MSFSKDDKVKVLSHYGCKRETCSYIGLTGVVHGAFTIDGEDGKDDEEGFWVKLSNGHQGRFSKNDLETCTT